MKRPKKTQSEPGHGNASPKGSVVCCLTAGQGHISTQAILEFKRRLEQRGRTVHIYYDKSIFLNEIKEISKTERIEFCLDYNLRMSDLKVAGVPFYDHYGFWYVSTIDTALNKTRLIASLGNNAIIMATEPAQSDIVHEFNRQVRVTDFLAEFLVPPKTDIRPTPIRERDIDVLFCGNVNDYQYKGSLQNHSGFFNMLTARGRSSNEMGIHAIAESIFKEKPTWLRELKGDRHTYYEELWYIMHTIRSQRRKILLGELGELSREFRCVVITNRHDLEDVNYGRAELIQAPITWEEYLGYMQRSKIVIHTVPLQRDSIHERALAAAHCGAALCSDANPRLERLMGGRKSLLIDFQPGTIATALKNALSDLHSLQEEADALRNILITTGRIENVVADLDAYLAALPEPGKDTFIGRTLWRIRSLF